MDKETDTFTVTVPVVLGDAFFGWVVSMGQKVTIVEPEAVKKQMVERMEGILKSYK